MQAFRGRQAQPSKAPIDLRDPQVDLRDVIVEPASCELRDPIARALLVDLGTSVGDPQIDALLERVRRQETKRLG